ncbi:conjugal transfer protein TraB [Ancylobacter defluvii]|nr:conjugal transfer protein TraB [Ancylobacter defluvii]
MLLIAAVATGWIGWSGHVPTLPLAMLFPALWAWAPDRVTAAAVSMGYFLAASRGLPQGVSAFYAADIWPGLGLWIGASCLFVGVHAALWTTQPGWTRALRYLAAAVLMAFPPFGITGWAHPVTAAGVLFPGWGWWGLTATVVMLLVMTTRAWPVMMLILAGLWLWSATNRTEPAPPMGWRGADLALGRNLGRERSLAYQDMLIALVRERAASGAHVVILPESALGFWTPTLEGLWKNALRDSDVTLLAGAAVLDRHGYDNVMVAISTGEASVLYRERMPVPVSMWQPWTTWTGAGGGARAHFFANPIAELDDVRIAPVICYEQLIVWPILQSMWFGAETIIAAGNGWWTEGSSIVDIQKASMVAWARLFAVPLVMSFNT